MVRRYIVGIEIIACSIEMLMSKKRSITNSCEQNIQNRKRENRLNAMSCLVFICDRMCSTFLSFSIFILLIFMFLAIEGIENIRVVEAMHIALASRRY